jgi:hypothetical protein
VGFLQACTPPQVVFGRKDPTASFVGLIRGGQVARPADPQHEARVDQSRVIALTTRACRTNTSKSVAEPNHHRSSAGYGGCA